MKKMQIKHFETENDWLEARLGRITGTKSKDMLPKQRGEGYRAGFYELIAERIALPADGENVMDRGKRLEEEAVERFAKETGKKVKYEMVLCCRDDDENIAYSPDALIGKTEDIEVKCLSSAKHIEALLTKKIPTEYESQIIQGFVVNDKLKTRYMVFYDPRMPKDFFYLTIKRKDYEEEIKKYLEFERIALKEIIKLETEFTF